MLSRDGEVSALEEALAAAAGGMGASLLMEGGIGTGKSYLARAALRTARARGFEVVSARARQAERNLPYGVLHQVRDQLLAAPVPPAPGLCVPGPSAPAPSVPDGCGPPEPSRPPAGTPAVPEEAAAAQVHRLLAGHATRRPVLLVVDDLQWTDSRSLHWLGHLMARLEGLPVALLGTLARDHTEPGDEETQRPDATSVAAVAAEFHRRVVLRGLNVDSVGYLLSSSFGAPVDAGLARACHQSTGGNPLLVQALLRELQRTGVGPGELSAERIAGLGSAEVAETLVARFETWFPGIGRALGTVAIMSRAHSAELVAELAGLDPVEAADVLHTLVRAGILDASEEGVTFSRPIVRTSFLAAMPPSERARLHAEAARALHAAAAPREEIAAHLLHSAPVGAPWAGQILVDAADAALADGEPKEARAYLERGMEECGAEREPELLRRLGQVELADDLDAAVPRLRNTLDLIPQVGDRRAAALADLVQAVVLSGDIPEALRIMEAEVVALERQGAEKELRIGTGALLELLRLLDGRSAPAAPPAARAVRLEVARTPWVRRAEAAVPALHAQWRGRRREEAVQLARLALSEPVGTVNEDAALRTALLLVLARAGEHEEALEICRALLAQATVEGSHTVAALARAALAECAFRVGRLQESAQAAYEALEHSPVLPGREWLGSAQARCWLGAALMESGDLEQAQRVLLDDSRPSGPPGMALPGLLFHRGRLHIAMGHARAGLADLEECGRRLRLRGWADSAVHPWRSEAALAHSRLGNVAIAERLAREELELARAWGAPHAVGGALRVLGLLAGGDRRAALLTEAVGILRESGAALAEAQALGDLGREYMRTRKIRKAREQLRAALALAEKCGAGALVRELRQDLLESGARPRRDTETGPASLTPAERRTALLAAGGLTNQEIANRLFVTRRTVEIHLSRAYRKLSISDRRDLHEMIHDDPAPPQPPVPRPQKTPELCAPRKIPVIT
ncbi:AAA family ATPase [Streptomyces sp. NPDC047971]|uniref:ATP-binding protein n=1 Tax=Streptomyces sp. NPDC047971 TaxID=3154499 RepID=UPI0033F91548